MAKLATQHITAGSPLVINKDNGDYIAYAEEIVLRGDASEENKGKELLTYIEEAIKSINPGGDSDGDITINDAILGGGLSFKNDKIELNLENYFKVENDKLGIKLGTTFELSSDNEIKIKLSGDTGNIIKYGNSDSGLYAEMQVSDNGGLHLQYGRIAIKAVYNSGLKIDGTGVCLNVDPNHFEISSNMLKLKDTTSGGGSYSLQEATDKILGGIYIHTGVLENQTQFIIPINKQEGTNEKLTKFGISVLNDDAFENDSVLRIKGNWWINNKYQNAVNNSEFILGTNGNSLPEDINNFVIFGNKDDVPGQRVGYFDNIVVTTEQGWPVSGEVSGHIIVNKSANVVTGNATRYTHSQMLYITNSTGNDYKIFMRDGKGGFTEEGTEGVSEWQPWKEIQGMAILQGSDGSITVTNEDLNKVVDSGMYAGVYMTDDYTMDEETAITTGIETFTMIVVNNYAMSAILNDLVGGLNVYFPKQIVQYKISSPLYGTPITNGSDSIPDPNLYKGKVQMRTGVHHNTTNTYVFTEWESIGGSVPIV